MPYQVIFSEEKLLYQSHFYGERIMHGEGKGMLQTLKKTIKLYRVLGPDHEPLAKPCKCAVKADMYLGPVFRKDFDLTQLSLIF